MIVPFRVLAFAISTDLERILALPCDGVVFELGDERTESGAARSWAREAAGQVRAAGKRAVARVNHPRTGQLRADLEAVVTPELDAVLLPHATEPQDVRDVAVLLREFEHGRGIEPGSVGVLATIDTARGLLRAAEIAAAAPRVLGLAFDGHHYAIDVGARNEEWGPRLAHARGAVVTAARANGGLPLVIGEGTECRQLAHYGFAGIVLTNAASVVSAAAAFAPAAHTLERARAAVAAYDAARAAGEVVARVHGAVIDGHSARAARRLLGQ